VSLLWVLELFLVVLSIAGWTAYPYTGLLWVSFGSPFASDLSLLLVLGLFLVAGDRRMDRVLTSDFVPLWKEAEEDDGLRKKKDAQRAIWKAEQDAREVLSCVLQCVLQYLS